MDGFKDMKLIGEGSFGRVFRKVPTSYIGF